MKKKSKSRLIKNNFSLICYAVALFIFLIFIHPLFNILIGNNQIVAWIVKNYYPTLLLLALIALFLVAGVAIKPSKLNLCLLLILIIFVATLKFDLQNLEQPTISYWDYIESFLIAIFWYLVMLERVNKKK
ncbi:hypothetical protein KGE51_09735 [Lactobacillus amylovorus]|nr:hypothetical protein [Lactobacillus amylovorus]UIK34910.1 hypothetical protein KGE51_09735 [Lactobacillus amylovorus]